MVPDPDWMSGGYVQPPPDLTTWMQDVDCFDNVDPFSSDFIPNVDDVFNGAYVAPMADVDKVRAPESSDARNHGDEDARRRHIAFQRSPWYEETCLFDAIVAHSYKGYGPPSGISTLLANTIPYL